ncbi:hypothetical protein PAAG_12280 [Paracoccidioides lutzii Pb01]|uniref:Uncharacterized protein n=1 Tax=Paracoccidioides lutzii (strain ATCC MYA-826 / Pb01) TaxID=502779 RepID=A0A0A2VJF0_PARBA|nr:hypothetical protein PAAG_12280 [Paracoccidioides lutzii Pb01]KGQ01029.1 hypothetical protein PAAG_12280 [Paracoccidioides lutzii Pb01]
MSREADHVNHGSLRGHRNSSSGVPTSRQALTGSMYSTTRPSNSNFKSDNSLSFQRKSSNTQSRQHVLMVYLRTIQTQLKRINRHMGIHPVD